MTERTKTFLSVDPGKRYFAWAQWRDGELVDCGLWDGNRYLQNSFPGIDTCCVEKPRVHTQNLKCKDDVVDIAIAAGEIAGQFRNRVYMPLQTLPKAIFQARTREHLSPEELSVANTHKKKDLYHIWDAIGYGLKYLGRI
jgi:hypothetical protein